MAIVCGFSCAERVIAEKMETRAAKMKIEAKSMSSGSILNARSLDLPFANGSRCYRRMRSGSSHSNKTQSRRSEYSKSSLIETASVGFYKRLKKSFQIMSTGGSSGPPSDPNQIEPDDPKGSAHYKTNHLKTLSRVSC